MMLYIEEAVKRCKTCLSLINQLHCHLITTGLFLSHPSSRAKLLNLLATSSPSLLPSLFRRIPSPTTNDYNALVRGFALTPHPLLSLSWYLRLSRDPCNSPDALTCSFALKACARSLAKLEATQLHSHVIRFGFSVDVLLQTTLLDVYAKTGDLDCARKVFDEMTRRDIASWNALISGLANDHRPNEALDLFKRVCCSSDDGLRPNEITVLGALSACSQLGAIKEGEKIWNYIINDLKLDSNVTVCNAGIDMFAKCGYVDKAYRVFCSMVCKRSLVTWNTMIMGFAMHGDGLRALEIFHEMGRDGVEPDSVSYLAALCACNHAGQVEKGYDLFVSMEFCGVHRSVKHYGSVVDLLGRAGELDKAFEIVDSMPTVPDVVMWQTLLGSCKTYGNVEMAEKVSRKLVEMGSKSCGDFVLLSNLYAAHERWDDVKKVREAMNTRDVRKVPGFSYIEVDGEIHKFLNGDKRHTSWGEICKKLEEIRFRIEEYGYVPETNYVLHDIGKEEKENALFYHSEKLAVAFGLIRTSQGSPIQVIKNLRICGDCHVVFKLVSKIYNWEIIVRDRTRFHRFTDGSCSCRDYW